MINDTLSAWFVAICQSILGTYALLVIIRIYCYVRLYSFFGNYSHIPADKTNFKVEYNWNILLNPVPNISIIITRKSLDIGHDSQNWKGVYNSDILNPYFFKGIYIIDDPGLKDSDGWHEVYLFRKQIIGDSKPKYRIGFNLHHLDSENNKWIIEGGYYIQRK